MMTTATSTASHGAEAAFGSPSYYRIWSGDEQSTAPVRRYEFGGWLLGWGEGVVYSSSPCGQIIPVCTQVSIYLTNDGGSVAAVTVLPGDQAFPPESPPDLWTTYAMRHGELKTTERWLLRLQRVSASAISSQAVSDAMVQAERALDLINERQEHAELLRVPA